MDNFEKAIKHAEIRKDYLNGDRTKTDTFREGWSECLEYIKNEYIVLEIAEETGGLTDGQKALMERIECKGCQD